jgi:deoxyhypusine synthase
LSTLQNQISAAKDSLKLYQSALDDKIQNTAHMHKKLARLENIKNNNKDYQQIEKLAEQKANNILSNKKALLTAAVISVLGALKNDPEKQLVIYDLFYNNNNNNNCYLSNNNDDSILYTTGKIMSSSAANREIIFHHFYIERCLKYPRNFMIGY